MQASNRFSVAAPVERCAEVLMALGDWPTWRAGVSEAAREGSTEDGGVSGWFVEDGGGRRSIRYVVEVVRQTPGEVLCTATQRDPAGTATMRRSERWRFEPAPDGTTLVDVTVDTTAPDPESDRRQPGRLFRGVGGGSRRDRADRDEIEAFIRRCAGQRPSAGTVGERAPRPPHRFPMPQPGAPRPGAASPVSPGTDPTSGAAPSPAPAAGGGPLTLVGLVDVFLSHRPRELVSEETLHGAVGRLRSNGQTDLILGVLFAWSHMRSDIESRHGPKAGVEVHDAVLALTEGLIRRYPRIHGALTADPELGNSVAAAWQAAGHGEPALLHLHTPEADDPRWEIWAAAIGLFVHATGQGTYADEKLAATLRREAIALSDQG